SIMGVPRSLLLLLILQFSTENTSGTPVTSCDSCHKEASCLESQERGDAFPVPLSCVCKDGFVGDGLACYNPKLCSDSSCCSRGYHWSPDRGCVDTDECSLPDSPCSKPQVCRNTPGSFECLEPSSDPRSDPSSQSVRFSCGHDVCPAGMDCISSNGNQCSDPCEHYTVLNDDWRSVNNTSNQSHCDRDINWSGWYRLVLGQNSALIPEYCVGVRRCGTAAPLWITEPHPTQTGEIVTRTVCNHWTSGCCEFSSHTIHVKLCFGNFYVYKLVKPSVCNLAYCADHHPRNPPSQLICGRDKIQVGLDSAHFVSSGLSPYSGNLASRNCSRVRMHNDVVWYEVEAMAGACGNTLRTNSTHAIYSNILFIYPISNASFNVPVRLPFSCAYPLDIDASLNVALKPVMPVEVGLEGSGARVEASMSLFRHSNYTETYPAGRVTLPVGSPLYVGVSVQETDPSFAVVLEDCYASHSSSPDNSMQYPLIRNRCPTDRGQVSVVEIGSSLQARFSAMFFLLHNQYRDVYLHCSLSLCDQRSSSCVTSCRSRINRSVSNSEPLTTLTIGPIIWEKSPE
ncbi:uromodulin-like, partial [Centropristis striata]|uniref:uromodulin-like n=1 Tax=Centropristis striata TaxID=184440 RepID=UPI0027E2095E